MDLTEGEDEEAEEELRRERSEFLEVEEDIILKDAISVIGNVFLDVDRRRLRNNRRWLWIFFFFSDKEEIKWRDLSKRVMFYFILSRDVM